MNIRAQQREDTRNSIIKAAIEAFSEHGFEGASTRDVADRAGVNQGLLTYYFKSKDLLWKEAANDIFSDLKMLMREAREKYKDETTETQFQMRIKEYVRFNVRRPELFRFIVSTGHHPSSRLKWLVKQHLRPMFEGTDLPTFQGDHGVYAFYALTGASSLMFAVRPLCKTLTGLNPNSKEVIETHADFIANLFTPLILIPPG